MCQKPAARALGTGRAGHQLHLSQSRLLGLECRRDRSAQPSNVGTGQRKERRTSVPRPGHVREEVDEPLLPRSSTGAVSWQPGPGFPSWAPPCSWATRTPPHSQRAPADLRPPWPHQAPLPAGLSPVSRHSQHPGAHRRASGWVGRPRASSGLDWSPWWLLGRTPLPHSFPGSSPPARSLKCHRPSGLGPRPLLFDLDKTPPEPPLGLPQPRFLSPACCAT